MSRMRQFRHGHLPQSRLRIAVLSATLARQLGEALKVHYPRVDIDLEPISNDASAGALPIGSLKLVCGADGECNALSIDDGRVQNLRFVRSRSPPSGQSRQGGRA
jgi:hypothetical protein